MLGGLVSSGHVPTSTRNLIIVAVAWLVSEPLLGSLLALSAEIARLRRARRTGSASDEGWRMPYVQPASPGGRALARLAEWAAGVAWDWRAIEGAGERWVLLTLMAVVLSLVAGGWVPLLAAVALLGLALVAVGAPLRSGAREALGAAHVFLAWTIGHTLYRDPDQRALLVGAAFAAIWYAWTQRPPLAACTAAVHILLATLLVAVHAPLSAGGVLLLAVPLLVLQPESPSNQRTYLPQTQLYLMASSLLAACGLIWGF
jgi:hypothetical protein